jgi:hypothetical protein
MVVSFCVTPDSRRASEFTKLSQFINQTGLNGK